LRWDRGQTTGVPKGNDPSSVEEASVNEVDVMFRDAADPVPFGKTFVQSDGFRTLFREGMHLVEETAAYLDGPGRDESRLLSRNAALTYASESMRLTTRLMQIASWLLVQRAVAEGEITATQALQEKNRVRLTASDPAKPRAEVDALPERLRELIGLAARMHARILHLDRLISDDLPPPPVTRDSPVALQHLLIHSAFKQQA
jgi:regulator of CtrA degradation